MIEKRNLFWCKKVVMSWILPNKSACLNGREYAKNPVTSSDH